jgi:glycosyltransferase involved in cell wall biosynthesis
VPVVCSGESGAAETVEQFGLGRVFEPENAAALAEAMRTVPEHVDPDNLANARASLSNGAVARAQLRAFDIDPPVSHA